MSGRIRTVKPELLEDAVTAGLSDSAFRVFIGMFLLADDYGNLRAEKGYLEGQIYWSAIPEKSVPECLKELSGDSHEGLVRLYRVRGQSYAHIRGWSKHQKVQHPGKPRVPGPELRDDGGPHETLTKVPETLTPDLRPPTSDHDPEQKGEGETLATEAAASPPVREEPESETRIKSVPPPPKWDGPKCKAIAGKIRERRVFSMLQAEAIAEEHVMFMLQTDQPLEWAIRAIEECAAKAAGLGMQPEALQAKLVGFMRAAKAPPKDGASLPQHVESDDPRTIERIRRMPKRVTAQDAAPVAFAVNSEQQAKFASTLASLGKGPQAPRQPSTEAELADKAMADRQRLAEADRKAGTG